MTAVWNGRSSQPAVKELKPGTYTTLAEEDGLEASSAITIESR